MLKWINNLSAFLIQSYPITSLSAPVWSVMQVPPAGRMWSSSGSIRSRQTDYGSTWQTEGKALRPVLWRTLSPVAQMWGKSKRWRWGKPSETLDFHWASLCSLTQISVQKNKPSLLGVIIPPLHCSSATMGPLQRAAGLLTSCLLLCQPKASNIPLLASAGWPKIEETG